MANNPPLAAGIDLGSNTFRLLIARCNEGRLEPLVKKLASVRLGRGLARHKTIQRDSLAKAFEVLTSFSDALACHPIDHLRICGTEALRSARNSAAFIQQAQTIIGHPVTIISSEEEARLTLEGAIATLNRPWPDSLLLVDVGGASTELIFSAAPFKKAAIRSLPVGAVSLTEQFLQDQRIQDKQTEKLSIYLAEALQPALDSFELSSTKAEPAVMGCGGTATSMAALDLDLTRYDAALVQGHTLLSSNIDQLWEQLSNLTASERNLIPGLEGGRGEILPAGMRIYQVLLGLLQHKQVKISDSGLLEGITLSSLTDNS